MARKMITVTALAATLAMAIAPVAASAHDRDRGGWDDDGDRGRWDNRGDRHDNGRHHGRDRARGYDQRSYAYQQNGYSPAYGQGYGQNYDRRGYYADSRYQQGYYGNQRRSQNRCRGDGTTGTIIGAIAGGLLGNSVAGRGDRTLGTVIGGGAGALAGRAIDRSDDRC